MNTPLWSLHAFEKRTACRRGTDLDPVSLPITAPKQVGRDSARNVCNHPALNHMRHNEAHPAVEPGMKDARMANTPLRAAQMQTTLEVVMQNAE